MSRTSPPLEFAALARHTALVGAAILALAAPPAAGASPGQATDAGDGRNAALADPKHPLPRPASWKAVLAESRDTGRPIVLMFSSIGCAWCELVRRDHLRHLARDQQKLGVIVIELDLLDRKPFSDGDSPAGIATAMGIRFAPTVAFVGPDGELAERLIGYQSADFYGAYLADRIEQAAAALKKPGRAGPRS